MKPVANGTVGITDVQTWENIQFLGGGFDAWGHYNRQQHLAYLDAPTAYAWVFGDSKVIQPQITSTLLHHGWWFCCATLRVEDGLNVKAWSAPINVTVLVDRFPSSRSWRIVIEQDDTAANRNALVFSRGAPSTTFPATIWNFLVGVTAPIAGPNCSITSGAGRRY